MSALQTKRIPVTRQAVQHLVDMMAGMTCEGEHAADLLDALAGMLKGSLYTEYGSVDLETVAGTMRDEMEAFEEPQHCTTCSGCGEGMYDGARCSSCHGKGAHPSQKEVMEKERRDEY
jgi:hypothetical protein